MMRLSSCFTLLTAAATLWVPTGCQQKDPPQEGAVSSHGAAYGDDFIGYKSSQSSRVADSSSSDSFLLASGGTLAISATATGGSTAAGGSPPLLATGASGGSLGGQGGEGSGARIARLDFRPLERGPAPAENPFFDARDDAVSTFSIDGDGASYSLSRATLLDGRLPQPGSVRIEEFLNYFHFHYQQPAKDASLSLYTEWAAHPFHPDRQLLMLGVQGQHLSLESAPPLNLVFLVDVSGSMNASNKLPLLKRGFRMLASQLRERDRVSLVTYASGVRTLLDGVPGDEKEAIDQALDSLGPSGSTSGQAGIQTAYEVAQRHFVEGGSNRVVLGTDGDFNVGISDSQELGQFIAEKRDSGVFLSIYGFGHTFPSGNFEDATGEQLARHGNGIYFYIDGPDEARRAFIHSATGSLFTVAKDVKLQVEFNPAQVRGYRLIGYESRVLGDTEFSDDGVDAGELGAGLSVTALYEIIPHGAQESIPAPAEGTIPESVIEAEADTSNDGEFRALQSQEFAAVRLRFKESDSIESQLLERPVLLEQYKAAPSLKFVFASGIAQFASLLRGSQYVSAESGEQLLSQLELTKVLDREGAIQEAEDMIRRALKLAE